MLQKGERVAHVKHNNHNCTDFCLVNFLGSVDDNGLHTLFDGQLVDIHLILVVWSVEKDNVVSNDEAEKNGFSGYIVIFLVLSGGSTVLSIVYYSYVGLTIYAPKLADSLVFRKCHKPVRSPHSLFGMEHVISLRCVLHVHGQRRSRKTNIA